MISHDDIQGHQELLAAHRRTLAVLLLQLALLGGMAHASPGVLNGIERTRTNIAHIKRALREAGILVDDEVNDEEPTITGPSTSSAVPANITFSQPDWKISGNVTNIAGDQRNINTDGVITLKAPSTNDVVYFGIRRVFR